MRLKLTQTTKQKQGHRAIVTGVAWAPTSGHLISVADDKRVLRWSITGSVEKELCEIQKYATDLNWCPVRTSGQDSGNLLGALACSDGHVLLITEQGKIVKSFTAHRGAVICIRWNSEGSGFVSGGEDGAIKSWSKSGHLRSNLTTAENAVYSISWSPGDRAVLYASSHCVTIKPLSTEKPTKWKAHEGTVLTVDWNSTWDTIVTGGEDCRYKVWDKYGRNLYTSTAYDFPITAVAWAPSGETAAIGSHNTLVLIDKVGWVYEISAVPNSGSLMNLAWTPDGTHLAASGATGIVAFAHVVDRKVSSERFQVTLNEDNQLVISDLSTETEVYEYLDFPSLVVEMSISHDYLIVATLKQCYIYSTNNFTTPQIFDIQGHVSLILQTDSYFIAVDSALGLGVYSYEGRLISRPKCGAIKPASLKLGNIDVSFETIAIINRTKPKEVLLIDPNNGRPAMDPIVHRAEICKIALSCSGANRKIVIIDVNREFWITKTHGGKPPVKLATMVDCAAWCPKNDILIAILYKQFYVWCYPSACWIDQDLLQLSCIKAEISGLGRNPVVQGIRGSTIDIRRSDGGIQTLGIPLMPLRMSSYIVQGQWDAAIRLCRLVKDTALWAMLAAMAIDSSQLKIAVQALVPLDLPDKLLFIEKTTHLPLSEMREAELALFKRDAESAEYILIQADLIYRAIKLNIRLFRWKRALSLAIEHRTHIDTVLAYRKRFLDTMAQTETLEKFISCTREIPVDWDAIKRKEEQEIDNEYSRVGKTRPNEIEPSSIRGVLLQSINKKPQWSRPAKTDVKPQSPGPPQRTASDEEASLLIPAEENSR